jgi:hypothetical protein
MKNDKLLPSGIYFNLPADDYFALPYFSRSLAQLVRFSGKEAEHRIANPAKATPAMDLGTAIHSMFLEPERFAETYAKAPALTDPQFANKKIIQTLDDLKPYLEVFGLKKSGKKEELIESVREYLNPAEVVIWDDVKATFDREVKIFGKKVLSDEDFATLQGMRQALEQDEELPETIRNGRAEVTIIWKDRITGVMCKCRLDYAQPLAITDIKSYSIKDFNTPLEEQLEKKTIWGHYNFQFAIYKEALETIIEEIKAGRAQAQGEVDQKWLADFLENPVKQFFILYVRTQAPYQMMALELKQSEFDGAGQNTYFSVAQDNWRASIQKYAHFLKTGVWIGENKIKTLHDARVPNAMWQQSVEV